MPSFNKSLIVEQFQGSYLNTNLFFSGTDYACEVHVISVDSCSPAERAGVKAGDVIVQVSISQILYCQQYMQLSIKSLHVSTDSNSTSS